jgi:hypothetical protein
MILWRVGLRLVLLVPGIVGLKACIRRIRVPPVVQEIQQPSLVARREKPRPLGLVMGGAGVLVLLMAGLVVIEPLTPGWLLLQYRLGRRDFSRVYLPVEDLSGANLSGADLNGLT